MSVLRSSLVLGLIAFAGVVPPALGSFAESATSGVCAVEPVGAPPVVSARRAPGAVLPRGEWSDLRLHEWRSVEADLISAEIPLQIPERCVGLLIRASGPSTSHQVAIDLYSPGGDLVACSGCVDTPGGGEVRFGRGSVQMPSTDREGAELSPGTYTFRVRVDPGSGSEGTIVDVSAAIRYETGYVRRHTLDLNFVYLPGSTLDAETAASSELFATFLERVDDWFAPLGIEVGAVTHVDLHRPDFSRISSFFEARRMFDQTSEAVGRARALNVYCIEDFDPPLAPAIGLAGGTPGPLENGTQDSGIVMRMWPFFTCHDCVDAFADLLAHEVGHYLGLYHTTEADLLTADPLLDTPRCPPETGSLSNCPDRAYVMFPLIGPSSTLWSAGQSRVAIGHPMVRSVTKGVTWSTAQAPGPAREPLRATPVPFRDVVVLEEPDGASPLRVTTGVRLFDVRGRRILELTGRGRFVWDGTDESGREVAPGIYFARPIGRGPNPVTRVVKLD